MMNVQTERQELGIFVVDERIETHRVATACIEKDDYRIRQECHLI
jgi:hypothetical protein